MFSGVGDQGDIGDATKGQKVDEVDTRNPNESTNSVTGLIFFLVS